MWPLLLVLVSLTVFLLPLLPALWEWRSKTDISPLNVPLSHSGHIQHFADHFRQHIDDDTVPKKLVSTTDLVECTIGNTMRLLDSTLLTRGAVNLPEHFSFSREVYGQQLVLIGGESRLQAVLSDDDLVIGQGSEILHWAHANHVYANHDCRLGSRISAVNDMVLCSGCTFTRLNAQQICFGRKPLLFSYHSFDDQERPERILTKLTPDPANFTDGRWISHSDLIIPENSLFRGDIIVHGHLKLHAGARIEGSVKAHGKVWLEAGTTITGSLIAGGSLHIAQDCCLAGPVVSEHEIYLAHGTLVGELDQSATVTAPLITIETGVKVCGTVWARQHGVVIPGST